MDDKEEEESPLPWWSLLLSLSLKLDVLENKLLTRKLRFEIRIRPRQRTDGFWFAVDVEDGQNQLQNQPNRINVHQSRW